MKTLSFCSAVLLGALALTSAAQSTSADPSQLPSNTLLISRGDVLHLSILDMPEMDQHVRVTDAGTVPVQGAGEVRVADLSPSQAAAAIHERLMGTHFLNHPEVSVLVEQYATQNVTLIGEIRSPGAYPIPTPRPILDVIALSGGLTPIADRSVLIERHGDQAHPVSYKVVNNGAEAIRDQVMVFPGDTIVVPKAGIVYVLGDVNRPGGYIMNNNDSQLTLLEALSDAGGVAKTARLGHARLIRKSDHSELQLSLGEIEKGKQPDFALLPGDILFVPFSYGKNLLISSSAGITGAASAAAIYTAQ